MQVDRAGAAVQGYPFCGGRRALGYVTGKNKKILSELFDHLREQAPQVGKPDNGFNGDFAISQFIGPEVCR